MQAAKTVLIYSAQLYDAFKFRNAYTIIIWCPWFSQGSNTKASILWISDLLYMIANLGDIDNLKIYSLPKLCNQSITEIIIC